MKRNGDKWICGLCGRGWRVMVCRKCHPKLSLSLKDRLLLRCVQRSVEK